MQFTDYVNPMIGTAGSAHTIPGPQLPHGMVKLSPDTIQLPCAGYDYNGGKILGFSHTHLEGVGGDGGRGNLLLTATTGPLQVEERLYASRFSHEDETARVGYYQVRLLDYDVNAELTATEHCGLHRYTFPARQSGRVLVDVGHTLGAWNLCTGGAIRLLDDIRFEGWGHYPLKPENPNSGEIVRLYFVGEISKKPTGCGVWSGSEIFPGAREADGTKIGLWLETDGIVLVKTAISYISCEKAWSHLQREIPAFDFEGTEHETWAAWEELLSRVQVHSPCRDDMIQFYSALYRALNQPTDYTEYDQYFDGVGGGQVYEAEGRRFYSDDWAIWDTFRTTHPLQNIVEPERADDQAQTLVRMYEHGGWLPMCTAPANGYNQTMIGHNASAVLADAVAAGYGNFDLQKAYEGMKKQATASHPTQKLRMLGTHPLYLEKGYLPDDAVAGNPFSVSETLEYVYGDWCAARMAAALGKEEDAKKFLRRAGNYSKLFDPQTGFMRPRRRDGSFVEPFDPTDAFKNGFCETTSWEYTFFVPHDMQGLINLIGSDEAFTERLDTFFEKGYYNNQNETGIQTPFLYNYAHRPWKTQETTLRYVRDYHHNRPGGLYPEDDAGAMSAWYVFASMGFYPVCPGQGVFVLTSPNMEAVSIRVRGGSFRIRCLNFSRENRYIQSARLNGKVFDRCWLRYDELHAGGELELTMGPTPNRQWASAPGCEPPSMTKETVSLQVLSTAVNRESVSPAEGFTVTALVENRGARGADYVRVWDGDLCAGRQLVFLEPGQRQQVEIPCRVFALGDHPLQAGGISAGSVTVTGAPFARFSCEQPPKLSSIMLPEESGCSVTVSALIRNTGSAAGRAPVSLFCGSSTADRKMLSLAPGKAAEVSFSFLPPGAGCYDLRAEDSPAVRFDCGGVPDYAYRMHSTTTLARYYQAGRSIYISAAGFQSREEYGILYHKLPFTGDFEASVRVEYEENTNPYARAGILVCNRMDGAEGGDFLALGAMSVRGYFFQWRAPEGEAEDRQRYAVGCPKVPYWFRLTKRGQTFTGCCSTNGTDWTVLDEVDYPLAAEQQYVGLFAQSGSELPRLVKFTDFRCRPL